VDGLSYHLSLTDTAGQEEYRSLWASSNLSSDAFLLVYDLTNPDSLDALGHYMELIDIETEHRMEENSSLLKGDGGLLAEEDRDLVKPMPIKIVAGNKCDLKGERRVSARHGLEWARRRGCGFMETSAREMVNIEETFTCN
jgi:GTPase KRas